MCIKKVINNSLITKTCKRKQKAIQLEEPDSVEKSKRDLALMKKLENKSVVQTALSVSEYEVYTMMVELSQE